MNIPAEAVQAASSVYENHTGVRDTLIVENILEAAAPFLESETVGYVIADKSWRSRKRRPLMTADRIPALLEPIQNRLPDIPESDMSRAEKDRARLLAAVQSVEEWCLNLDAVEKVNPSSSDNLNASAGAIADVLRKSVAAALGSEA